MTTHRRTACVGLVLLLALTIAADRPATTQPTTRPAVTQPATRPAKAVAPAAAAPAPLHPFRKNVKVEVTDKYFVVHADGIPDHTTGDFPNATNPNRIVKQSYVFKVPRHPVKAEKVTKLPMGPIGVAVNGVPFYNPYNAEGRDAAKNEVFDSCCGHPDPMGRYHYHIYPRCIHTSFTDAPKEHSPLIGYAFDGYAIFGPNGEGGTPPADLDECNGHTDATRGYHYHVTNKFPYILGGYRGEVERGNLDGGGRGPGPGMGGPGRQRGPGGNGPPGGGPPRGPRPDGPPPGGGPPDGPPPN
ncbi:MAG: YHYH protein [Planctomycetota bacterium]|nr:YHYH protein [Planctomycetota bacterium]